MTILKPYKKWGSSPKIERFESKQNEYKESRTRKERKSGISNFLLPEIPSKELEKEKIEIDFFRLPKSQKPKEPTTKNLKNSKSVTKKEQSVEGSNFDIISPRPPNGGSSPFFMQPTKPRTNSLFFSRNSKSMLSYTFVGGKDIRSQRSRITPRVNLVPKKEKKIIRKKTVPKKSVSKYRSKVLVNNKTHHSQISRYLQKISNSKKNMGKKKLKRGKIVSLKHKNSMYNSSQSSFTQLAPGAISKRSINMTPNNYHMGRKALPINSNFKKSHSKNNSR